MVRGILCESLSSWCRHPFRIRLACGGVAVVTQRLTKHIAGRNWLNNPIALFFEKNKISYRVRNGTTAGNREEANIVPPTDIAPPTDRSSTATREPSLVLSDSQHPARRCCWRARTFALPSILVLGGRKKSGATTRPISPSS